MYKSWIGKNYFWNEKDPTYHYMSMRHEVIKGPEENTVLIDNTKKGSYSKVFPEAFGEKKQPIAIKIQNVINYLIILNFLLNIQFIKNFMICILTKK